MNDVIEKHQNKTKDPVQTVKRKEVLIVLPFLGHHSKHLTKQLMSCINKFHGIFRTPEESSPFLLTIDKLAPSFRSKVLSVQSKRLGLQ